MVSCHFFKHDLSQVRVKILRPKVTLFVKRTGTAGQLNHIHIHGEKGRGKK